MKGKLNSPMKGTTVGSGTTPKLAGPGNTMTPKGSVPAKVNSPMNK